MTTVLKLICYGFRKIRYEKVILLSKSVAKFYSKTIKSILALSVFLPVHFSGTTTSNKFPQRSPKGQLCGMIIGGKILLTFLPSSQQHQTTEDN